MIDTYATHHQARLLETPSLYTTGQAGESTPVACLGLTFDSDAERRAYFTAKLRAKLQDPAFRRIEGFPIGSDDDILALSDPPYYTACPNPFIPDFLQHWQNSSPEATDPQPPYSREPFAADVSEGKNDPIYNAHSYHTKVPHKAIMRYILHYTEPGDVVFDGFCGTGMTGVAAQLCGDRKAVESLGYRVDDDGTVLRQEEAQDEAGVVKQVWKPFTRLGARRAILNDLSPAATFIAYNYNTPVDVDAFEREAKRILAEVEAECGWMYATLSPNPSPSGRGAEVPVLSADHVPPDSFASNPSPSGRGAGERGALADQLRACHSADDARALIAAHKDKMGRINYTVWSDVFVCPQCNGEIVFWDAAVDHESGMVREAFFCPHCNVEVTKRALAHAWSSYYDRTLNRTIRQTRQTPVLLNYSIGKRHYEKSADVFDKAILSHVDKLDSPYWFPADRMPEGDEARRNDRTGVTHVHHYYVQRSKWILSALLYKANEVKDRRVGSFCRFLFEQWIIGFSRLNRYSPHHFSQNNRNLAGTLYFGSQISEVSPDYAFTEKLKRLKRAFSQQRIRNTVIATQSAERISMPDESADYLFIDPPFGDNLMYSDLNFLWEAWLRDITNNKPEAVQSKTQNKGLDQYRVLMTRCFAEAFRILKPGRWMTVEFSNTQASVWNAIQTALQEAGFVVANVSVLDKQRGSFKAVTTTTAVKQDLVISAYKPNGGLEERFTRAGGGEASTWDFVRAHLHYLPVTRMKGNRLEVVIERDPRILYDRVVAYFVRHGFPVPLSSIDFQTGLAERFIMRDNMAFLSDQAAEYDRRRLRAGELGQQALFVQDERSAIDWLRNTLGARPSTTQDLLPEFMQQLNAGWKKYEVRPELQDLLALNFLRYEGAADVPNQIHGYLSTNFKECRNLPKDDPALRAKANGRWYVPDPNKAGDLERIRETQLLREFDGYLAVILGDTTPLLIGEPATKKRKGTGAPRRLREFRLEALRAGFKRAWQSRDFQTIVEIGKRLPEDVVNEDPRLLLWYGQAQARLGG